MFVFISSHLLCYPGGGGWLHLWRGIEAAWWQLQHFPGTTGPFQRPLRTGWITALSVWSALSPKASGWSPRQEMLRKGVGCSPCCRWRIQAAQRAQGKGVHYFQYWERCSQKMPQMWRSFIKIQSQHIYLWREGEKTRINWLSFERSSPNLVAKSSQIKALFILLWYNNSQNLW